MMFADYNEEQINNKYSTKRSRQVDVVNESYVRFLEEHIDELEEILIKVTVAQINENNRV